jgi:FkbM family methyltransferase
MLRAKLNKLSPHAKIALRNVGRKFGLEIRLNGVNSREDLRFVHFLEMHNINTVLDVGANKGQFATELFKAGFKGRVISFEPLPEAHAELMKAAAAYGDNWVVGPRIALSNKAGTARFFVTEANTSSSLLEPLDSFVEATPIVRVDEHIEVETERLDSLSDQFDLGNTRTLLKLDVQGSETKVLEGAPETLKQLHGVLIELSFASLYDGQSSALGVQQSMADLGFDIWDIWRGYHNPQTFRLNQVDALFFRAEDGVKEEG